MTGAVRSQGFRGGRLLAVAFVFVSAVSSAQDRIVVRQPADAGDAAATEPVGRCIDGSQIVRLSADGAERLMTNGFLAACDPAVSFDGQQILFSGRRSADERLQVWRMDPSGNNIIRITDERANNRRQSASRAERRFRTRSTRQLSGIGYRPGPG